MNNKYIFLTIVLILSNLIFGQYPSQTGLRIMDATAATPSPGVKFWGSADTDGFLYSSKFINGYGFGFYNKSNGNAYNNGTNTYLSGFFGIDFFTNSQHRLRINRDGNVGIGTNEPSGKLDINFGGWGSIPRVVFKSNLDNPGINFYRPTGSGATAYPWRIEENLGALEFQTGSNANIGSETLARKFYIDNSKAFFTDNVGIGTETPLAKLHVEGDINSTKWNSTSRIGFITNDQNTTTGRAYYGLTKLNTFNIPGETVYDKPGVALSGYYGLGLYTGDSEAVRINSNGNVGIGTENPTEKLQIGNNFTFHSSINQSGHDVIGFGFTPSTATDLNTNAHSAEIRFKKTGGTLSLGISQDNTSNPTTALEIWKNNNVTMSFYDWGKVGIGTNTPAAKLHVSSTVIPESSIAQVDANLVIETKSTEKSIDKGATLGFVIPSNTDGGNLWQQGRILVASDKMDNFNADGRMYIQTRFFNYANNTWDWSNNLVLRASGNVGIGTSSPTEKLDISSDNNSVGLRVGSNAFNLADQSYINLYEGAFHHGIRLHLNGSTNKFSIKTRIDQVDSDALTIPYHGANAGFVGIGTANPDSKLTVKGSIHAEEVKVDLAIAPDYVFEKYYDGYSTLKSDYKMPTLQEVEAYTKENKHLPEVPSAQEIKENGLKLGEMNAILLQKVEELTLYLIEQNKEIEKLKTKVDELSKK